MNVLDLIEEETNSEIIIDPEKMAVELKARMDELISQISDETSDRASKDIIVDTPQVLYSFSKLMVLEEMDDE